MDGAGGERPPASRLLSIPKEGERVIAATRRPDGTYRKPVRIRPGHVPQDEVPVYQSKGAILKKEAQSAVPPGYEPTLAQKPKSKSAKRNEKRKEKREQAAHDKEKQLDSEQAETTEIYEVSSATQTCPRPESVESVTDGISKISVTATPIPASPSTDSVDAMKPENFGLELDKKIRAVKKKIRLAEAQLQGVQNMNPEQIDKKKKIEGWLDELKLLEDRKANSAF